MKFLFILLLSVSLYAQDTLVKPKQSVIGLDKLNVVYRGIENPISIAVNNAKSYKINGLGVRKDEKGNYTIAPGRGLTTKIYVEITQNDDTVIVEEHEFRIKDLNAPVATLNGNFVSGPANFYFSLEDLENAKVGIKFINNFFMKGEVKSFNIKIPRNSTIVVKGNIITDEILNLLKKSRKKDIIIISEIKVKYFGIGSAFIKKIPPIAFSIIE